MHSPTAQKAKIIWLQGVTCNGNTHSFLNYEGFERFFQRYDLLYHPLFDTELGINDLSKFEENFDFLILEGAVTGNEEFKRGKTSFAKLFEKLAKKARYILAAGSCASYGGVFKEYDPENITGIVFDKESKRGIFKEYENKTVNIPGCPLHPEWLITVLDMLSIGKMPHLDEYLRPKELYAYLAHDGCIRNEYFEWKIDVKDFGYKEGCLYYEHGCRGPMTHASCNKILWNSVSSKTMAGMPCIGCTEPDFPKTELFETKKYMSIPAELPFGIPKRAYLTVTGITKAFKIDRLEKRLIDDSKRDN
ncbi:hydrogenase [Nitrosophilus alvini]|uniref:NADH-quinone oxidoreductase subunit B family protein n=1 Tax=Nitrosophilus alvini TaxID=2714855 RepID=UPI00190B0F97|nr:hydrogenase [Nitrosophilus alvini]